MKVPRAKKVRAWGAAPKRPERPAVQSQNGGTHAQTGPTGTEAKPDDEPLAWNPPPPSAPIAINPASNPPPPASMAAARGGDRGARGVIGAGVVEGTAQVSRVASNSSPLDAARRRRDRRIAPRGGRGRGQKRGGRDGDRGRDRRRSRDSGRREPKVEVDRWGDPVRRVSREPSAMTGTAAGWTNPGGGRRRHRPPPRGLGRPQRCDRRRGRVRRHRRGAPRRSRRSERLCRPRRRRNGRRLAEETPRLWQPELLAQGKFILMRFEKNPSLPLFVTDHLANRSSPRWEHRRDGEE